MTFLRFRKNDLNSVYEKYADMLYRLALSNSSSREDAEDAVHDAFASYLTNSPAFSNEEHERAWLIRVTVNKCRDILRRNAVRTYTELEEARELPCENSEVNPVIEALRQLPERYRTAITLHYLEGYNVEECGSILNLSESAVKMRLSRGRLMLREIIEKEGL